MGSFDLGQSTASISSLETLADTRLPFALNVVHHDHPSRFTASARFQFAYTASTFSTSF